MIVIYVCYSCCHSNLQLLTVRLNGYLHQNMEQMSEETEQGIVKKEMLKLEPYKFRNKVKKTHLHLAAICGNLE